MMMTMWMMFGWYRILIDVYVHIYTQHYVLPVLVFLVSGFLVCLDGMFEKEKSVKKARKTILQKEVKSGVSLLQQADLARSDFRKRSGFGLVRGASGPISGTSDVRDVIPAFNNVAVVFVSRCLCVVCGVQQQTAVASYARWCGFS